MSVVGGIVAVAAVVTFAHAQAVFALDAQVKTCGAGVPGNHVRTSFDIPVARDIRRYLPNMGDNPELQVDKGATVVVFDGPTQILSPGTLPSADDAAGLEKATTTGIALKTYDNVVCVIVGTSATVYADVDTSGLASP